MIKATVSQEQYAIMEAQRLLLLSQGVGKRVFTQADIEETRDDDALGLVMASIYIDLRQIASTPFWNGDVIIWFLRENYFRAPRAGTTVGKRVLLFKLEVLE